jgi:signal transduction histidine kinase
MTITEPECGFTIVCRVKPGRGKAIRALGAKFEEALQKGNYTPSLVELRHLRWTLFDNDKRILYSASSEHEFGQYIDDAIALAVCTSIAPVFEHLEGFPLDWRRNRAAVVNFARSHQCHSLADCSGHRYHFENAVDEMPLPNRSANESQADQSPQWLLIRESERKRIAQELHDTTVQELASAKLYIENAQQFAENAKHRDRDLQDAVRLLEHSLKDLRTLSYVMHPPMLDELGVAAALRWHLRGFEGRTGIKAVLKAPKVMPRFSVAAKTAVFRIVQEALTNVYRHSESKVVTVFLGKSRDSVVVSVIDRGKGMPRSKFARGQRGVRGLGISGMRARAEQFDGILAVKSSCRGTTVRVGLPLASVRH